MTRFYPFLIFFYLVNRFVNTCQRLQFYRNCFFHLNQKTIFDDK
jgi:hypothetical protein